MEAACEQCGVVEKTTRSSLIDGCLYLCGKCDVQIQYTDGVCVPTVAVLIGHKRQELTSAVGWEPEPSSLCRTVQRYAEGEGPSATSEVLDEQGGLSAG